MLIILINNLHKKTLVQSGLVWFQKFGAVFHVLFMLGSERVGMDSLWKTCTRHLDESDVGPIPLKSVVSRCLSKLVQISALEVIVFPYIIFIKLQCFSRWAILGRTWSPTPTARTKTSSLCTIRFAGSLSLLFYKNSISTSGQCLGDFCQGIHKLAHLETRNLSFIVRHWSLQKKSGTLSQSDIF